MRVRAVNQGDAGLNTAAMIIRSVDTNDVLNPPSYNPLGWDLFTNETRTWVFYAVSSEEITVEEDEEPSFSNLPFGPLRFVENKEIAPERFTSGERWKRPAGL